MVHPSCILMAYLSKAENDFLLTVTCYYPPDSCYLNLFQNCDCGGDLCSGSYFICTYDLYL